MDVFYLKYRPQKFSELDGINARDELIKIVKSGKAPHSFLFAGPRGTGKTSAARILAKFLNCPNVKSGNPCGKCDVCLEIERGAGLDVLEIDAASNRGIDDIRDLKEKISFQPLRSKNKVYIVDEVHMLTREAFNAFLKTLEEPPVHAYFIFCTTNPEKIPDTVLSRLTVIEFPKGKKEEIVGALERVVKGEKIKVDKKVLEMIAEAADGSFRDAHKVFYQLWIESGKKIDLKKAERFLGHFNKLKPDQFLTLLAEKKLAQALSLAEELEEKGVNFEDYLKKIAHILKDVLLNKFGAIDKPEKEVVSLSSLLSEEDIIELNELTIKANFDQKTTVLSQLPLEMMAVSYLKGARKSVDETNDEKVVFKQVEKPRSSRSVNDVDISEIAASWGKVLEAVRPKNHSVGALLRACRPVRIEDNYLVLEVFYSFHKDRLSDIRNREIVEEGLRTVFGCDWRLKCVLGEKLAPKSEVKSEDELYDIAKDIFGE